MTVIGGCEIAVNGESTVASWLINYTRESRPIASSNTNRGVFPVCGVWDWIGSYVLSGHTPVLLPGYSGTFTGSTDGSKGVTGPAIGRSIRIEAAPMSGDPIRTSVEFEGNGLLTVGAAVAADATDPNVFCPHVAKVEIDTGGGYAALSDDITAWGLEFRALNTPYVSTGTNRRRKRIRGPFGGLARVTLLLDDPSGLPAVGDYAKYKFYVTDTLFWLVEHMRLASLRANPAHPLERNEPVAWDLEMEFSARSEDGTVEGTVTTPGEVEVWPYS